jgi:hypothetical protein
MRMSDLLEQLELTERDTDAVGVDRAYVRIIDAYNRKGSGGTLDAISNRIKAMTDPGKIAGMKQALKNILSNGGTTGLKITSGTEKGESLPKWSLTSSQKEYLSMLIDRL